MIVTDQALDDLNTLRLAARARHFARVESVGQLQDSLAHARTEELPVIMLGGGSNVVLGAVQNGLVLQMAIPGIEVLTEDEDVVHLRVGAGENWHSLVEFCLQQGWQGLENLALIPGTAGAAPIQNIGAYGVEFSHFCKGVEVVELDSGEASELSPDQCGFGYRDSAFKGELKDRFAVTAIRLRLNRRPRLCTDYLPLEEELRRLGGEDTAAKVFEAVCRVRRRKLPDPTELANVGSFFKNPVISALQFQDLLDANPGLVAWTVDDEFKLAAAWLLEEDGWRGRREGPVGMHDKQALVLVNHGGASARQVLDLAATIQASIRARFGVDLEIEPRVYPGSD